MSTAPRVTTQDGFFIHCAHDELVPVADLQPNPRNPNKHPNAQIELLAKFITAQGWRAPITISRRSGLIVRGHARQLAAQMAGSAYAPVEYQDYDSDESELADLIADNRIAELAVLDDVAITELLAELNEAANGVFAELAGYTPEGLQELLAAPVVGDTDHAAAQITLQEKFSIPPYSVLDARQGSW
jgi:ParB-like chromosome segregation protein Spo0J